MYYFILKKEDSINVTEPCEIYDNPWEKTFKAFNCQMCGKYFKKKTRFTENMNKNINICFVPC